MNAPAAALLDELAAGGLSTAAPPPPDLVPPLAADLPAPPAGLLGLWFATWAGGRTLVHVARGDPVGRVLDGRARRHALGEGVGGGEHDSAGQGTRQREPAQRGHPLAHDRARG